MSGIIFRNLGSGELEVWVQNKNGEYELLKTYDLCAISGTPGPKMQEGDEMTPEGFYTFKPGHLNPNSQYHLSFNVNYPNKLDRQRVPTGKRSGGLIMVHGMKDGRFGQFCASVGCLALTNDDMEELYTIVHKTFENGEKEIPIHIFPFKDMEKGIQTFRESKWIPFWKNLNEGKKYFDENNFPAEIKITNNKYVFTDNLEFLKLLENGIKIPSQEGCKIQNPDNDFSDLTKHEHN